MDSRLASPFALMRQAWMLALSRHNVISYLILGFLPQLVSFGFSAALTRATEWEMTTLILVAIVAIPIITLGSAWYTALLYQVYQATAQTSLASLTAYIRPAKNVTWRLLTTYILVGLWTLGGMLLLVIPGIIVAVRYGFAPIIAATEDRSVKPIDESRRLVKGRFWKLIGRGLLFVASYNIPLWIFHAIHPYAGALWAVTSPIFGLYVYLVYADFKRTAPAAAQ